jgi:hypothetical protein
MRTEIVNEYSGRILYAFLSESANNKTIIYRCATGSR